MTSSPEALKRHTMPSSADHSFLAIAVLILTTILLAHQETNAGEIYKWIDADGRIHFSDHSARRPGAETVNIRINTYSGPPTISSSPNDETPSPIQSRRKVIIYTTTWCGVCKKAKLYLDANGIPYREYDVENSAKGRRDYKKLKGRGVPIILVGNKRMNGFQAESFKEMYN